MERILYCHCAYARVVPVETKAGVLQGLANAGIEFDAVPDLCEMAARRDPRLGELASGAPMRIAACYPRAVRWLFASAGVNIDAAAPWWCNGFKGRITTIAWDYTACNGEPPGTPSRKHERTKSRKEERVIE